MTGKDEGEDEGKTREKMKGKRGIESKMNKFKKISDMNHDKKKLFFVYWDIQ